MKLEILHSRFYILLVENVCDFQNLAMLFEKSGIPYWIPESFYISTSCISSKISSIFLGFLSEFRFHSKLLPRFFPDFFKAFLLDFLGFLRRFVPEFIPIGVVSSISQYPCEIILCVFMQEESQVFLKNFFPKLSRNLSSCIAWDEFIWKFFPQGTINKYQQQLWEKFWKKSLVWSNENFGKFSLITFLEKSHQ